MRFKAFDYKQPFCAGPNKAIGSYLMHIQGFFDYK
jgi:hypothetical protein